MTMEKKNSPQRRNEQGLPFVFRLYVTGTSSNSSRAITNIKKLFEMHLKDRYELHIIDVYQQPHLAKTVDIIALPLLIRKMPLPERRLIGDMSDGEKVIKNLGLLAYNQ
jgi:circadian clock protein KaiB